jgi:phosphoglycerol transferase
MTGSFRRWIARPGVLAVGGAAIFALLLALPATGLLTARWDVPLTYSGDGLSVAAHVKTIMETGWYEWQPALGWPAGQNYHDYATGDELNYVVIWLLGIILPTWGAVMNAFFLIGFPLAAAAMAWFARRLGIGAWLAGALGVVYALAPYHFLRAEGHLFLGWYWVVPLGLVVVWRILVGEPIWGARPGVRRGFGHLLGRTGSTVVILAVLASVSAYYALFIAILGLCAALGAAIVRRGWRAFWGAVAAGGVVAVVIMLNVLPDWIHSLIVGPNPGALVRTPVESEVYALKLVQLLLPAPNHRFGPFQQLRALYDEHYPLPSESPALGIIGAVGLVALIITIAVVLVRALSGRVAVSARSRSLAGLAFLAFIALLFSWVGGVETLVGFVTQVVRGWNRMSIVIAAIALAAVGLLLGALIDRATRPGRPVVRGVVAAVVAFALVGIAYWDQVPAADPAARAATVASFDSDAAFVAELEAELPPGSAVFQLPYIDFPESPPVGLAHDADQFRLFLHSTDLVYSGGGIRGREAVDQLADVAALEPAAFVDAATDMGFAGVSVDRFADPDGTIEDGLVDELGAPSIVAPDGRFAYWSLG